MKKANKLPTQNWIYIIVFVYVCESIKTHLTFCFGCRRTNSHLCLCLRINNVQRFLDSWCNNPWWGIVVVIVVTVVTVGTTAAYCWHFATWWKNCCCVWVKFLHAWTMVMVMIMVLVLVVLVVFINLWAKFQVVFDIEWFGKIISQSGCVEWVVWCGAWCIWHVGQRGSKVGGCRWWRCAG